MNLRRQRGITQPRQSLFVVVYLCENSAVVHLSCSEVMSFREDILQLLSDSDSELRGKMFQPPSSVFPSSRQGRTLFGDDGGDDEAEMMIGLRSRALLEAAKRPEETPSFAESLEIQSRWKRDGEWYLYLLGFA